MRKIKMKKFPEEIVLARIGTGEDEFLNALESRETAADETKDEHEKRIAVYRLVKVLLPTETRVYNEVENDGE